MPDKSNSLESLQQSWGVTVINYAGFVEVLSAISSARELNLLKFTDYYALRLGVAVAKQLGWCLEYRDPCITSL